MTEALAIKLLAQLYIMCEEQGDFSNDNTHNGLDEGQVLAGRFLGVVGSFLKGRSAEYDRYCSDTTTGKLPF